MGRHLSCRYALFSGCACARAGATWLLRLLFPAPPRLVTKAKTRAMGAAALRGGERWASNVPRANPDEWGRAPEAQAPVTHAPPEWLCCVHCAAHEEEQNACGEEVCLD